MKVLILIILNLDGHFRWKKKYKQTEMSMISQRIYIWHEVFWVYNLYRKYEPISIFMPHVGDCDKKKLIESATWMICCHIIDMSSVLFSRLHIRDLLLLFILESYLANIQYSYRHISTFAKFVAYLIFERDILYNICVKHMVQWPKLALVTLERTPSQGTHFMNNVDMSNWFAFGCKF